MKTSLGSVSVNWGKILEENLRSDLKMDHESAPLRLTEVQNATKAPWLCQGLSSPAAKRLSNHK